MTIRTLELVGTDPARWGEQHGEAFRDDIRAIYEIRLALTLGKTDLGTADNVLELARRHVEPLRRFDAALHAELCGIARGSGLTPEEIVVVNHYTDLRDLRLSDLEKLRGEPDGCSALFVARGGHRILGQTWDMHGSAEPYALLIKIPSLPDDEPVHATTPAGIPRLGSTLVFSITGCLGMTGMTSWGLGLTINNLNSVDATIGVVWPAMVRRALRCTTAKGARDLLMTSPIGSGRHYIVADGTDVFGIETSGTKKKLIHDGGSAPYFHTNHCVDDEMAPTCRIPAGSTTLVRYETLRKRLATTVPDDARAMFDGFADVGLPYKDEAPHDPSTCGALVMDLTDKNAIACQGLPGPDADAIVLEVHG